MSLRETLSPYWLRIQEELLPWLDDAMDSKLSGHHRQLVGVLGMARIEAFLPSWRGLPGRPPSERAALARAFVAKAVFNVATTRRLIEMLSADKTLRRLCGWQRAGEVPSEATFARLRRERAAIQAVRRADRANPRGPPDQVRGLGRAYLTRQRSDRGPRVTGETGSAGAGGAAQTQARPSTQGRASSHRTTPADRAPTGYDISRNAG